MGQVIQFPRQRKQKYFPSLGGFQSEEEVDYARILSEYEMIKGPDEKIVVYVPIRHIPASEDDSHAVMTVVIHLSSTYEGRRFLPVGPTTIDAKKVYIIKEC